MPDLALPRGDTATWTTPLDPQALSDHVNGCRTLNGLAKGKALEQLLAWLIPHLPGFRVNSANTWSGDGSQEVDLVLWHDPRESAFPNLADRLLVECKNWVNPVGSAEVAWFYWKLKRGNAPTGVLVAANGVTGNPERRSEAISIIHTANGMDAPVEILLVTLEEIEVLATTDDLKCLIQNKLMGLTACADPLNYPPH